MAGNKYPVMKSVVLAAALAASVSGVAYADDNSMSPWGGDSYNYFNRQTTDKSPSEWRQTHPNGDTERELQSLSSESPVWQPPNESGAGATATASNTRIHATPLTERELQALSAESPVWQLPSESGATATATATASKGDTDSAQSPNKGTLVARMAHFFHRAQ